MFEKDLFFSNENINSREFFLLNEVVLELPQNSAHQKPNALAFSIIPYLNPETELSKSIDSKASKPKRIREQIMFSIEPIPLKVGFNFIQDQESQ